MLNPSSNLFSSSDQEKVFKTAPLSARMRPQSLEEYVGQKHILGAGMLLPRAIESDRLSSLIIYGPPGIGKTTLAHCISLKTESAFERINAVASNVEEMRKVIAAAQNRRLTSGKKTILFIDEIHRFNKAQQDVLMPDIEDGNIILIGATVFNPFFALTSPLLSRSIVIELKPLTAGEIQFILLRALTDKERGLGLFNIKADQEAIEFLADVCNGDGRKALNSLEIGCLTTPKNSEGVIHFSIDVAIQSIQKKQVQYDRDGDQHYDTASAFIKSMRGSDPDATLYWLAKMIYAGEDPRFIARRICICASEDVGNADPRAVMLATSALQAAEIIGMPEARIILAQAAVYVACAPKSNASYAGIERALKDVQHKRTQEVPESVKDSHYSGAQKLGRGKDYKYAHDYQNNYVQQDYVAQKTVYYEPTLQGYEAKIKQFLQHLKELDRP
ncbi:MAG: replication-associated recombination protein A [Candidatus Omnitrophica bacterium]|nr:replication-associated recombination protein A [Candidatus Omnitrophota bacterium]